MAKREFQIIPVETDTYEGANLASLLLTTAAAEDLEELRNWKNDHRQFFFYKNIISVEEQLRWFEKYSTRDDDYIFMVIFGNQKAGCLGFRIYNGVVDIYNVILGEKQLAAKGIMSRAITLLCSYLKDSYTKTDITVRVLLDNPARSWYRKNNFNELDDFDEYVLMKLDTDNTTFVKYKIEEKK